MADAAEDSHLVTLELHSGPSARPEPSPGEVATDVVGRHLDVRGEPFSDCDESRTVRFTCG
ncbi:unannotated protein [freshwater metagenome]|uniref:Unannotated protein n=1 Tax=freshwater metagenome TaxID=449393 RepID=A0A6J7EEQ5_9ZZZZ